MTFRPTACRRALEWSSLALDGELSELERRMLDAHLDRCASCRTAASGFAAFTTELRRAELERLERPVVLPDRRRLPVRSIQVAAAAALVVVAAGLGSLSGAIGSRHQGLRIQRASAADTATIAFADSMAGLPRTADDVKKRPKWHPGLYPGPGADI